MESFRIAGRTPPNVPQRASGVGTDLRAVRRCRRGAVGDIALPPELPGPWPACSKTRVPSSNRLRGRDRFPSRPAPQTWRFRRHRPTREAAWGMQSQRCNWIGRTGCAFFRECVAVRWLRASIGLRFALASSCKRICCAVPGLPTESFWLRLSTSRTCNLTDMERTLNSC